MKKYILSLLAMCAFGVSIQNVNAQNVSTTVQERNVLLEDFTGIKCGNCPDGHAIVTKIKLAQPDRVFPIAVHAGSYAKVTAVDRPNFIIDEGAEINEYFNIERYGYPIGMTNRTDMGAAGKVQSRSYWTMSSRTLTRQNADVNVWVGSTYNKDTRVISTDVELYYTSDIKADSSSLCVSLLQSDILGPQAGADMGDEYVHNHVLRAMFTPVWGDTIRTSAKGTLVRKHYEYTLPEIIGNVETDPQHMDVVAYVIDTDKAVMNVNGCRVQCPEMSLPTAAALEEYRILPVRNNAFPYLECYLVNEGTEAITSATFTLTIDDDEVQTVQWVSNGSNGFQEVEGQTRGYLKVPVQWPESAIASGCDYKLKLTGLNGKTYAGATIKGSFGAMLKVRGDITATIKTDKNADDNTFRLLDSNGNVVATYGPYAEGSVKEYSETIHFPSNGIYCFEIADAWGNGILNPRGSVKWYDADGNLVASNTDIQNWGYRIFFNCQNESGIDEISSNGYSTSSHQASQSNSSKVYNLSGQKVTDAYRGVVIQNGQKTIR